MRFRPRRSGVGEDGSEFWEWKKDGLRFVDRMWGMGEK
jgi:hypothetical protein